MFNQGAAIFENLESNVQSYSKLFPKVFNKATGSEIWDVEGNRYLDFLSGCGSLNYGHNHPVLKEALIDYLTSDGIAHGLDLHTQAKGEFLDVFNEKVLKPRELDYVVQFTGPTGTNAVEAALKLVRKVTGRNNVICFTNGFHGVTAGALAVTGNRYNRAAAGMPLTGATVAPYYGYFDLSFDSIGYLEQLLSDPSSGVDRPAAAIVEVVQGEGGLSSASAQWLQKLQQICRKHQALLIVDDIQAGCGRTGDFFSFEKSFIKPDIVTLAKSLSGYGLPFAAVLINRSLDQWLPGEHNGTFRGNNHAFVTATAAIQKFWNDTSFTDEVLTKSELLKATLIEIVEQFSPHILKVRGQGMMRGLLCKDPKQAAAITKRAFSLGLILERSGPNDEVIKLLMPLTTSLSQMDEGLAKLRKAIESVLAEQSVKANHLQLGAA